MKPNKLNRCSYIFMSYDVYQVWIRFYGSKTYHGIETPTGYSEMISEHIQKVDAINAVECFEKEKIYKKMGIPKEVKTIEVAIRKVNKFKDDYYPFTIGSKLIKVKRRKRCK